jgi:pSer/pThr/pTyr-binding forkhead associated (FHA) protein
MQISLVRLKKDGSEKSFPLPSTVTVIGRRRSCDLRIPLASVSKKHCQLNFDDGVLKIRDLGSRNGTILNGKNVTEAVIQHGDKLSIGPLKFMFRFDGLPSQPAPAATETAEDEMFASFTDIDESDSADNFLNELEKLEQTDS